MARTGAHLGELLLGVDGFDVANGASLAPHAEGVRLDVVQRHGGTAMNRLSEFGGMEIVCFTQLMSTVNVLRCNVLIAESYR